MSLEHDSLKTLDSRDEFGAYNPDLGFWLHNKVKVIYPLWFLIRETFKSC